MVKKRSVAGSNLTPNQLRARAAKSLETDLVQLPKAAPRWLEPMKCRLTDKLPQGEQWVYEIKFDGFRGIAIKEGREVRLISRNNKDLGGKFPGIVQALQQIPADQFIFDGEVVALDEQGRSSFQLLQCAGDRGAKGEGLFFYVFDLLNLNGRDTTRLPLSRRKELLKRLISGKSDCIRFSDVLQGDLPQLSGTMQKLGLEGLVAKRRDSKYEPGQRSGAWVKFKWGYEQEFVIGGYTDPEGSRPYFGSVLVGYYERGLLIFAAKVGTGFNTKLLKSLYERLQKIRTDRTPFANLPERGGHLTAAQMRFCKWVDPELVCQVRFTEWTRDGHLRQPVFLGLREDKSPLEAVKETADSVD